MILLIATVVTFALTASISTHADAADVSAAGPATATNAEPAIADQQRQLLLIAGKPSHGYGSHEHYAGLLALADSVRQASPGTKVRVIKGWPDDEGLLKDADAIVIYCDGGGRHLALPNKDALRHLLEEDRPGGHRGFGCLHYAVEVPTEHGPDFLDFLGGYFETHWSVNPHWVADFQALPEHPIATGVQPFKANDEWYFHMRFRENMAGVTPILSAVPPQSTMRRRDGAHSGNPAVRKEVAAGKTQHVMWAFDRPGGGRSFGFTGGHYHWNWGNEQQLKVVTNALLWIANAEIANQGSSVPKLSVAKLEQNQDYDKPKNYNAKKIA
ncbi:MAG: ThuA domain-containing protein, partial [Planctomycetota bacterium]